MEEPASELVEASKWGAGEYSAVVFFAISCVAWLAATPVVAGCLETIREDPESDGMIGVAIAGMAAGAVGVLMLLVSTPLALAARRLPAWLRLISLLPGALALLFVHHAFK